MPHQRYFVKQPLQVNDVVIIEDTEFHHLSRVMRQKKGECVEIINGQGKLAIGTITIVEKERAKISINRIEESLMPSFSFTLQLAILKPTHLEFALEKAVELGVSTICLFPAKRSEKKEISETYFRRLQGILIAACKQCGRLFLPNLVLLKTIDEYVRPETLLLFGDPYEKTSLIDAFRKQITDAANATLLIGPEAGFTEDELSLMRSKGAKGVKLHPYTLRAETAALYGSTLISHWLFAAGAL